MKGEEKVELDKWEEWHYNNLFSPTQVCSAIYEECKAPADKVEAQRQHATEKAASDARTMDFVLNGDKTVTDKKTGLMWATEDSGDTKGIRGYYRENFSWFDAKSYCENYDVGGYTDWRMPTLKELAELSLPTSNREGFKITDLIHLSKKGDVWASDINPERKWAGADFSVNKFHFIPGYYTADFWCSPKDNAKALPVRDVIVNKEKQAELQKAAQAEQEKERAKADAYFQAGQYGRAIGEYNIIIRLSPRDYKARFNRGQAYGMLKKYDLAIEDFNEIIRLKPELVEAYNSRGLAYISTGNNELGCKDAKYACKLGNCSTLEWAGKGLFGKCPED